MRCPDCNKFVSFDAETEPEIDGEDVDADGNATADVRIVNNCAECGGELKEATFQIEADLTDEVAKHRSEHPGKASEHDELEVEMEGSRTERTQTHDRRGKKITNYRYAKHYYGADVTVTVTCKCGETFQKVCSDEVQGSGMDELV